MLHVLHTLLFGLTIVMITGANYLVFLWVPLERTMGAVQKLFYFHVGSAVACYAAIAVVFICSAAYLALRRPAWDIIAAAAGEVGFIFCTIVLASGMIWARAAWNTWFSWEPRLVTFLLLWLVFLSFNILRIFGDREKVAAHAAVLGILGALTVPLVIVSVKLMPQLSQLHPRISASQGLHPSMRAVLLFSIFAVVLLQFSLLIVRTRLGFLEHQQRIRS